METKKVDVAKMQRRMADGLLRDDELEPEGMRLPQEPVKENVSLKIEPLKEEVPVPVERTRRKTTLKGDYETLFMQMKEFKDRKAIYISRELHQEIAHFLGTIKSGELSVGAYVENIINDHLEVHKDEMDTLYESKFKKPSQRFRK